MRLGIDLSCLIPQPMTGVSYAALHLFRALMAARPDWDYRVFSASAQPPSVVLQSFRDGATRFTPLRFPTRLHVALWTGPEWPPIEWFTGPVDVAHGAFHLLPAARRAKRLATVFDLTGLVKPETHTNQSNSVHRRILEHAARRADRLVAVSQRTKQDIVERLRVSPDRVDVVYCGISLDEFDRPDDPDAMRAVKDRFHIARDYFIHIGTIEPRKNIPRLLRAYARVRQTRGDIPQLVLAGKTGWKSDDVPRLIEELGLRDDVLTLGYIDRADAVLLLKGAYACVYPSLYEGFGLPVLEAMAARVPVLTSNVSSLPEVIGDTGIVVDPESDEQIEAGLADLIENPAAARARVVAARRRAEGFTWAHSAQTLARVYEDVLA